ncbi:MAG: DUF1573 domain-containing protein [Planctomycetota bacterium]
MMTSTPTPRPAARLLAFLGALALALVLPACDDSGAAGPGATTPTPTPTVAGPMLTVDRSGHDFGPISDVQPHTTSFTISNTGTERLIISEIKRGCGCTSVSMPKYDFAPGEQVTMQVVFDPKRKTGRQEKAVTLLSNTQPDGVTKIDIAATVEPMLRFLPEMIRFGTLKLGQEHHTPVRMYYSDPDLEIREVSTTHASVTATLLESGVENESAGPGSTMATIDLRIAPDAPWGVLFATRLVVRVYGRPDPGSDPIEHAHEVFVTGTLTGELTASPQIISLGPIPPGDAFRKTIQLRRTNGAPFSVEGLSVPETTMQGVRTDLRQLGPNVYEISLFGQPSPDFRGGITGFLAIRTNVPGEESLRIRFAGFVR